MPNTSFNVITRHLRRQSLTILGSIVMMLVLCGLLLAGAQNIIERKRDALTDDFANTVSYVQEQEQFLLQLRVQNGRLTSLFDSRSIRPGAEGQASHVALDRSLYSGDLPFSVIEETQTSSENPAPHQVYLSLGRYLADHYFSFWAFSYFPSPSVMLLNESDDVRISVPAISAPGFSETMRSQEFDQILSLIRKQTQAAASSALQPPLSAQSTQVLWIAMPGLPNKMLALVSANLPSQAWQEAIGHRPQTYLASLMSRQRLSTADDVEPFAFENDFWLSHAEQGLLLGSPDLPQTRSDGFTLTAKGLVLRLHSRQGDWTGHYLIGYGSFFRSSAWWLPVIGLCIVALALLMGLGYIRWYRHSVIDPAQKAQSDLLESESFNRTLIDTAPIALCLLTRSQGEVVFASSQAQNWLPLAQTSLLPHQPDLETVRRQILHATQPGVIEQLDLENGRSLHIAYAPTRYQKQDVVLCAITDLTTRAEEQRALERAKTAADQANEAKTTFLATMSHEIRTPLYGVIGTLELLALSKLDRQQSLHVQRIQASSQLLLRQISDILDVSKIEAGQLQLEIAPFDPRELVQQCTASYAAMAQQKKLLLFSCIDPDIPEQLLGDASHLRQILTNLISNAIKFTQVGHVIVRLRLVQHAGSQCLLRLQVADTGMGITKDQMAELFTPFYRAHTGKHTVGGTGLGLSICNRLAQLMQGQLQVTSEPGLGSSFTLELNLLRSSAEPSQPPDLQGIELLVRTPHKELSEHVCRWLNLWGAKAQIAQSALPPAADGLWLLDLLMPASQAPSADWRPRYLNLPPSTMPSSHPDIDSYSVDSIARGLERLARQRAPQAPAAPDTFALSSPLHVLIAEDNPINQATLSNQLEQLGCTVSIAGNGEEALTQWNIEPHDLVLTDVNMPCMNGYELTQQLRAMGVSAPIIGVTANAMRDEEQRCMQSGMNAWLVKPIELKDLYKLLCQFTPQSTENARALEPATAAAVQRQQMLSIPVPEQYRSVFRSTMQKDIALFGQSLRERDIATALQKLHRMRGALAAVGSLEFANFLGQLEDKLSQQGWEANMADQLAVAHDMLEEMLANT
ncbi:ATP-binding protein [Comamonas sp. GB3 AK4-5]|uniref:hybrid sensor histidine kinase/response regulator n=1 Tax=Comamonas sp. GB3 AK4-5 TaxID=3231487 RepID=UPI00351F2E0B